MLLVVTPSRLRAPRLLPRPPGAPLLGRGRGVWPRGSWRRPLPTRAIFWRILAELPVLRFSLALSPVVFALLFWPEIALPVSAAPVPMFLAIVYIESNVLGIASPAKRRALIDAGEAARGRDLLALQARAILTRMAAARGMTEGSLALVVEQSGLARLPPLTLVWVEAPLPDSDRVAVLELSAGEIAALETGIFDKGLTEPWLHRIALAESRPLTRIALDAAGISSHARLAALAPSSLHPSSRITRP